MDPTPRVEHPRGTSRRTTVTTQGASTIPPPPPPPAAPPPPPPLEGAVHPHPSPADSASREALLSSIQNFPKGALKKADMCDYSAPRIS